jgi:holo-[acyl-carrier protein] synthase
MLIYQGIDIVEISKFKKVFLNNNALISDIFTEREKGYCLSKRKPYLHLAGRFAAKEATLKALGIGITGIDNTFKEIEIIPNSSGKPMLGVKGWVEKISRKKRITQFTVSISHSENYAIAAVILAASDAV